MSLSVELSSDRIILCKKIVSLRKLHTINNMVKLFHRSIRFRSFFDLIVKKYEINKSQKCTPFWHKMFKIAFFSGGSPPNPPSCPPHDAPSDPLVVRGFLPSAIAASRLCNGACNFPVFHQMPDMCIVQSIDFLKI